MENQPKTLEELITTTPIITDDPVEAATQTVELPTGEGQWLPVLIEQFSQVGIFTGLDIDKGCSTILWPWSATLSTRGEGG